MSQSDWLAWRRKGLGSSDAPVLMGESPWRTLFELWLDKTGQIKEEDRFKGNWATRRGQELEPEVRKWYNNTHKTNMRPENMVSSSSEIFRASFDGIDHEVKKVIEIKCPSREDHEAALRGQVPTKYYAQCQWLLMVSGYPELDYVSFNENYAVVSVTRDVEYCERLIRRAYEFWGYVKRMERPPGTTTATIDDPACSGLLTEYQALTDNIKRLESRQKELMDQIKAYVKEGEALCGEFKLQWVERKGAIDYSEIPQLIGVDLEQYRKKPTTYFAIKKDKKSKS
jgi:putative phage-type endonuclease